jgi:hypothetical protein
MLDHVHGSHSETCAVDDAADLAVETDVIEIMLRGLGLPRILLRGIVHVGDVVPAEQRVVVEGHLGIECEHAVVLRNHERIDLEHDRVVRLKLVPVGLNGGRNVQGDHLGD